MFGILTFYVPPYPLFDLFPKHGYTELEIGVGEEGIGADDIYCGHAINMCMRRRQRLFWLEKRGDGGGGAATILLSIIKFGTAPVAARPSAQTPPPGPPIITPLSGGTVTRRCTGIGEVAERAAVHRQSP